MHVLIVGAIDKTVQNLIIGMCRRNTLDHREILQSSHTAPLVAGPMGILREAPRKDLQTRVANERVLLDILDPQEVAGIVLGGFGTHIRYTRFGIAQELRTKYPSIPILVFEDPSTMTEIIAKYGGSDHVVEFKGVELVPPRVHIVVKDPGINDHVRVFINLCARRLSAS